jgi:YidC/Oxa1 family membrane protein insertase
MNENRNLFLAIILSAIVLLGWEYFVAQPQMQAERARQAFVHKESAQSAAHQPAAQATTQAGAGSLSRKDALAQSGPRVQIETPTLDGSLRLTGARFDDLHLKHYHETVNPKSPEITLLSPVRTRYPYYAVFGFVGASAAHIAVPGESTPWKLASGNTLAPGRPVTLTWDNGQGLLFTRKIAVDDQYMFTVSDSVANRTGRPVQLYPYGYVARDGLPDTKHYWVLHEGFVGAADGALKDASYDDFKKDGKPPVTFQSTGGWVGITDKYWMAAAIPPQNQLFDGSYRATPLDGTKAYQADYRLSGRTIAPGATLELTQRLFAGAKVVSIIRHYEDTLGIERFDLAIDWGWFIFLTKPIFWLLDFFYGFIGNFGVAILLLTVAIKLIFFPLADASYRSMSRMKKLQPDVERIRERFAEDKLRQQQEMMALYKREKINPVSGCLPMLIQIPVFFSLYKVLFVTIEMRQAPFFGWIHDLSAPDPTCFINLFGLLPFGIPQWMPSFLLIGIWPAVMGVTQWLQTKMNPAPADPVQARMFAFMPLIFTFMLATFPAGLVIYWTWNNLLSTAQQYVMMRRQGVEVHLFNNLKAPDFLKRLGSPNARASTPPGE